ncbi:MAG TPA: DUF4911 domain-containing protein [Geobacteraceae bacterium]|jgi:hypothetical protein|nr:DUF4911 domain-containing protein [Geobacteraceae bacterium]
MLTFTKRYYRVNRSDIAYLRFIIESYDGLASLSTVDNINGIVSMSVPGCFVEEVDQLVQALKSEITISEIAFPDGSVDQRERHDGQEQIKNA